MKTLMQRINQVMKEVDSVTKGKTIRAGSSSYDVVEHDDVTAALHTPFANHGIVAIHTVEQADVEQIKSIKRGSGSTTYEAQEYMAKVWIMTTFFNADDKTDSISVKSFAYAFDPGDKAIGKAYSMAVKYTYLKALMLESKDKEEDRPEPITRPTFNLNGNSQNNTHQGPKTSPAPNMNQSRQISMDNASSQGQSMANVTPASEKQLYVLNKNGIKYREGITAKEAFDLISELKKS